MESGEEELLLRGLEIMCEKEVATTVYLIKSYKERIDKLNFILNAECGGAIDKQLDDKINDLVEYAVELEEDLRHALAMQTRYIREMKNESRKATALTAAVKQRVDGLRNGTKVSQ